MITYTRKIVSLVLLSVFVMQVLNQVFIVANYAINKDYISKVLCENKDKPKMHCNGKCHLKKQLAKEEKKEQSPVKEKKEIQLFYETNPLMSISAPINRDEQISSYSFPITDKHQISVFHPPQV